MVGLILNKTDLHKNHCTIYHICKSRYLRLPTMEMTWPVLGSDQCTYHLVDFSTVIVGITFHFTIWLNKIQKMEICCVFWEMMVVEEGAFHDTNFAVLHKLLTIFI